MKLLLNSISQRFIIVHLLLQNLLTLMDLYLNGEVLKKLFSKNVSLNLVVKVSVVMT